jgi:hypothetical protein
MARWTPGTLRAGLCDRCRCGGCGLNRQVTPMFVWASIRQELGERRISEVMLRGSAVNLL